MTETNEAGNCGSGFRRARGVMVAVAAGLLWAAPAWVSAEVGRWECRDLVGGESRAVSVIPGVQGFPTFGGGGCAGDE